MTAPIMHQLKLAWAQEWINLNIDQDFPLFVILQTDSTKGVSITHQHFTAFKDFEEYCKYKTNALSIKTNS